MERLERIARIAVCDDDQKIHGQVHDLLLEYNRQHPGDEAHFSAFADEKSLLDFNEVIDLLFLDIELGETSGVDVVPLIRQKHPDMTIMFISSHTKYFIFSHRLNVFQFLTKPFDKQIFFEELDRFFERFHLSQDLYTIEMKDRTIQFPVQEIVYMESSLRYLKIYHYSNKIYEVVGQIGREEQRLKAYGFIRSHHGYLVNARYIEYLKGTELVLNISDSETSDERLFLPVSRNKLQQTRQQYQQWLQQQRS